MGVLRKILWMPLGAGLLAAQTVTLGSLSEQFQALAKKVNASVVKVVAVGYRLLDEEESTEPGLTAKQRSSGSGTIIDDTGLVVTNAHVVVGAQRVNVTLPPDGARAGSVIRPAGRTVRAEVLGLDLETDIALLRIAERRLPALRLADSDRVEQGQIVLAFGSPLGLDNSVSMGVVSSTARQLKPDDPMIYIQTDAPINPGNSGGPLVDAAGNIVGINTLILSQSGGSEGLGFAVPASIVASVVKQLKAKGRVTRGEIGVHAQTITATLAAGWKLAQNWGVVLADVEPEMSAAKAGLQAGDIVLTLNGKVMENARQFDVNVYLPVAGALIQLEVLRAGKKVKIAVAVVERPDPDRYTVAASKPENLVAELGIFGIDLSEQILADYPNLRKTKGVLVTSRSADGPILEEEFRTGDVIYAVNREAVGGVAALRAVLKKLRPGDPVAVQVERQGRLAFLAFELP
jgi:serine protease Do